MYLAPLLFLTHCQLDTTAASVPESAAPIVISARAQFEAMNAGSAASRAAAIAQVSAMTPSQFHQLAVAKATDASYLIDGKLYGGAKTRLQADASVFADYGRTYKTMGDLWRSINYNPQKYSYDDFLAGLSATQAAAKASLALLTGSVEATYSAGDGSTCDMMGQQLGIVSNEMISAISGTLNWINLYSQFTPYLGSKRIFGTNAEITATPSNGYFGGSIATTDGATIQNEPIDTPIGTTETLGGSSIYISSCFRIPSAAD